MADYFYDGMLNVNERLNQLYAAFAAGPYNALPLTGGGLSGPVMSTSFIAATALYAGNSAEIAKSALLPPPNAGQIGADYESLRLGVAAIAGVATPGYFSFLTASGNGSATGYGYRLRLRTWDAGSGTWSPDLLEVGGNGRVVIPTLKAGEDDLTRAHHQISSGSVQGDRILDIGAYAAGPSVAVLAGSAATLSQPLSVMHVGKVDGTGRGITTPGTINTSGNDYAEYVLKSATCGTVAKGQIVGITKENTITDKWGDAVMFAIKSTAPSYVGGDTWASCVGPRPTPQAGQVPSPPPRRADVIEQRALPGTNPPEYQEVVTPGDTDAEWAAKQATYAAALAAHDAAMQLDAKAMAVFDAALEAERQKVDRIAIAGRVPVNVLDAQPGDYIVPAQDGAGIKGIAVRQTDLTHLQYLQAVGRVISIEPDGRAYVMVKVV